MIIPRSGYIADLSAPIFWTPFAFSEKVFSNINLNNCEDIYWM